MWLFKQNVWAVWQTTPVPLVAVCCTVTVNNEHEPQPVPFEHHKTDHSWSLCHHWIVRLVSKVHVTEWLINFSPLPFIDQLKGKINLNVDDMDKLTVDDLRSQVDYAISQVNLQESCISECETWWLLWEVWAQHYNIKVGNISCSELQSQQWHIWTILSKADDLCSVL